MIVYIINNQNKSLLFNITIENRKIKYNNVEDVLTFRQSIDKTNFCF
jgi:hypothetical protein